MSALGHEQTSRHVAKQAWEAGAPARAAEAARQAEAVKQQEEAARQAWEAGAPARAQAEEARRQAEAATEYTFKVAYVDYIIVKRCHIAGYISEPELAKAQAAVSAIEQKIKKPNIDLDALWKQANTVADDNFLRLGSMPQAGPGHPRNPVEMLCNGALVQLTQIKAFNTNKDF
jgi:hypothetical protein